MFFVQDPSALKLLESLAQGEHDLLSLNSQLRKQGHDPEKIAWVLQQLELKSRAKTKLGERADSLLFTRAGLEQASRWPVATYHTKRLASLGSITDLGCGIGIDALAMSEHGLSVVAVERDSATAEVAQHNLRTFQDSKVLNQPAEETKITTSGVWLDPARRDLTGSHATRKMLSAEDFSPSLDFVFEALAAFPGGAKLSPAFPHDLIPDDLEATWVSHNRELVETTLWSVDRSRIGKRYAVMIRDSGPLEFTGDVYPAKLGPLQRFVFEPDPALIRSGLIGSFADTNGLHGFAPEIAYLTASEPISSPWLRGFEVIEELPLDKKIIRGRLSEMGIGSLEIKKRGVDIDPALFRKELRLKGLGAATLILTRVGDARRALVCAASQVALPASD